MGSFHVSLSCYCLPTENYITTYLKHHIAIHNQVMPKYTESTSSTFFKDIKRIIPLVEEEVGDDNTISSNTAVSHKSVKFPRWQKLIANNKRC